MTDVKRYKVSNGLLIVRGAEAWNTFNLQNLDVVLASDYETLAAELADMKAMRDGFKAACDGFLDDIQANKARIRELEAALRQIRDVGQRHRDPYVEGSWFAAVADSALGSSAKTPTTELTSVSSQSASAQETPVRHAHSKSEYKRLTTLGVKCTPPETACEHSQAVRIPEGNGSTRSYCPECGKTFPTPYVTCVYCAGKHGDHGNDCPQITKEKRTEQCAHEVAPGTRDCVKCNAYLPLETPVEYTGKYSDGTSRLEPPRPETPIEPVDCGGCGGTGYVSTGIDEMPTERCRRCGGLGTVQKRCEHYWVAGVCKHCGTTWYRGNESAQKIEGDAT